MTEYSRIDLFGVALLIFMLFAHNYGYAGFEESVIAFLFVISYGVLFDHD